MWLLTWSNLRAHKGRFALVLLGLSAILTMMPFELVTSLRGNAAWNQRMSGRWLVAQTITPQSLSVAVGVHLPKTTGDTLLHLPGIDWAESTGVLLAELPFVGSSHIVVGLQPGREHVVLGAGTPHLQGPPGTAAVLLSPETAGLLAVDTGGSFTQWGRTWHVAGILAPGSPAFVLPLFALQDMLRVNGVTAVVLTGTPDPLALAAAAAPFRTFGPRGPFPGMLPLAVYPSDDALYRFATYLPALVAVIGIYASSAATEQVSAVGVLRALGFGRMATAAPVALETAALCLLAGAAAATMRAAAFLWALKMWHLASAGWVQVVAGFLVAEFLPRLLVLVPLGAVAVVGPVRRLLKRAPSARLAPVAEPAWNAVVGITVAATASALLFQSVAHQEQQLLTGAAIERGAVVVTQATLGGEKVSVPADMDPKRSRALLSHPGVDPARSGIRAFAFGADQVPLLVAALSEPLVGPVLTHADAAVGGTPRLEPGELALGRVAARALHTGEGQLTLLFGREWRVRFVLSASAYFDEVVLVRWEDATGLLGPGALPVELVLYPLAGTAPRDLAASLRTNGPDLNVLTAADRAANSDQLLRTRQFGRWLGSLIMMVAALMLVLVTYNLRAGVRRRQVLILHALGAPRGRVAWHVLGQAALIAAVSGVGAALLLPFASTGFNPWSSYPGVLLVVGAAVLAGIPPTIQALRSPSADALRGD